MTENTNRNNNKSDNSTKQAAPTLEETVAKTILQANTTGSTIEIDGCKYEVTEPTPATLMLVSAEVSKMPKVSYNSDNVLYETLRTAKDTTPIIGKVAAILILGAKRIRENRKISYGRQVRKWSWRHFKHYTAWETSEEKTELEYLAEYIAESLTIATLSEFIGKRLGEMQVGDFFGLTTSLSAVNILKPTKEVETARGE